MHTFKFTMQHKKTCFLTSIKLNKVKRHLFTKQRLRNSDECVVVCNHSDIYVAPNYFAHISSLTCVVNCCAATSNHVMFALE